MRGEGCVRLVKKVEVAREPRLRRRCGEAEMGWLWMWNGDGGS